MDYSYDVTVQSSVRFLPCRCLTITSVARHMARGMARASREIYDFGVEKNNIAIVLSLSLSLPNYADTNNFGIPLQTKLSS